MLVRKNKITTVKPLITGENEKYIVVTAHNRGQTMLGKNIKNLLPWMEDKFLD